ncbi:Eco57I restriction-modification methylase [Melghirimyces profundicolus]|uniref:site-specific DNA-methyltransferase (adenine-specific) n=1 Tax=Melghirimyces profundicolus TaxID=1242148 RepID=A0A2T6B9J5_9BACL|nr:BREX-1 system adenine-specific DNA-methyltransferase PglX [Melghirimyces profundicolus]PTX52698.1 Eco57I restriction-modification methylase [Melghirimyces profundicolus]
MNKTALKNFAVFSRKELIKQVELKAKAFGITPEGLPDITEGADYIEVNQVRYGQKDRKTFTKLFQAIREKGFDQLVEEVAYTWFNRLIAIRYMEVHNYLPSRIRVLSSATPGKVDPDILTDYHPSGLPVEVGEIDALLQTGDREGAYRKLLIAQCDELSEILPFLFEKIDDYAALLLPDNLLHSDSVINVMNRELSEEDFAQVEVIGWLYQYYISEKKDEIFSGLKKNNKIGKDSIPAATQMFTPRWIVRYMVENSLGHLWLESHPGSELKGKMTYYIEPAEQEEEVQKQLEELRNPDLSPEEITVLDPACGSGHILVYAFDLLYLIYEEQGYPVRDIPTLILEKNLYGIDIDKRAAQLAAFALMMKARKKSRRVFRHPPKVNILAIEESDSLDREEMAAYVAEDERGKEELQVLLDQFVGARNFGSILQPESGDVDRWIDRVDQLFDEGRPSLFNAKLYEQLPLVKGLLKQASVLAGQYDVVVTNPPYMGSRGMNPELSRFVKKNYPDSKGDLFTVFMERSHAFARKNGFSSSINQHSWMFLSSYEKLRNKILDNETIISMLHLGPRAFEDVGGEVVQSTSYVMRKIQLQRFVGSYHRLVEYTRAKEKEQGFLEGRHVYYREQSTFQDIPGSPIAYWVSDQVRKVFRENKKLGEIAQPKQGLATTDNNRFLRLWHEVQYERIGFGCKNVKEAMESKKKWFPHNKGGPFRKWYGNQDYVVNWENNGKEIKEEIVKRYPYLNGNYSYVAKNIKYYFYEGITWGLVSSGAISFRYSPKGLIPGHKGSCCYIDNYINMVKVLSLLNSKVQSYFLGITSPSIGFEVGAIKKLPMLERDIPDEVYKISMKNISISKTDWDSFETSWDFQKHPFLTYKGDAKNLAQSYANWAEHAENQFNQLKANEEELNRIFIDLYGLQEELTPEVPDEEVTVRKADRERDAKSFLSYCVGLIMGRYSLDVDGLAYAGGEWDSSKYRTIVPDQDGIVPLTDVAYFEDDIITWLNRILTAIYGESELAGNLQWLAESLGKIRANESAEERIRRYFFDEFYKDHCRIYQKRPIYWMADSGKKKGMRALIYLHRYNPHTLGTLRFRYVQELQMKLRQEEKYIEQRLADPTLSASEKRQLTKKRTTLQDRQEELIQYDQKLAEVANRRMELDLDDGVVENYKKLGDILAKIR